MAYFDNLLTVEQPWGLRSTFNDSWFSDTFAKETETLTKVLQNSFSSQEKSVVEMGSCSPFTTTFQTLSGPTVSVGSENETAASKRRSSSSNGGFGVGVSKKVTKRKPRASKRASTTYITADVDSFRQMVQQVTGVRFAGNGQVPVAGSVLKPEPRRPVDRVQQVSCLPTLDTSAFLLDPTSSFMPTPVASIAAAHPPCEVVADGGFGFGTFSDFPTLESWERNIMQ